MSEKKEKDLRKGRKIIQFKEGKDVRKGKKKYQKKEE